MIRPLALLVLLPFFSCSQDTSPVSSQYWHRLGSDSISFTITQYRGTSHPVLISLHDDESTSLEAAAPFIRKQGGVLIKIENKHKRSIRFRLDGKEYGFDPNRMFSKNGIVQTLVRHKRVSNQAISEVERFASFFLSKVPADAAFIVALHNNIEGSFSIASFTGEGEHAVSVKKVSILRGADPDDFLLTTDQRVFDFFQHKFSIVLQHNELAADDGSLSVFYGKQGITYLNCETQHGHSREASRMMAAVYNTLDSFRN